MDPQHKKKIDRGSFSGGWFEGEVWQPAYILKWGTIFYLNNWLHSVFLDPEKNEKQQTRVYFKEDLRIWLIDTKL